MGDAAVSVLGLRGVGWKEDCLGTSCEVGGNPLECCFGAVVGPESGLGGVQEVVKFQMLGELSVDGLLKDFGREWKQGEWSEALGFSGVPQRASLGGALLLRVSIVLGRRLR